MVLLLGVFALRGGVPASFEAPAAGLVGHLTLFILPASLGILEAYERLMQDWAIYALVLLAGSLVTAVVTAAVAGGLLNGRRAPPSGRTPPRPPVR